MASSLENIFDQMDGERLSNVIAINAVQHVKQQNEVLVEENKKLEEELAGVKNDLVQVVQSDVLTEIARLKEENKELMETLAAKSKTEKDLEEDINNLQLSLNKKTLAIQCIKKAVEKTKNEANAIQYKINIARRTVGQMRNDFNEYKHGFDIIMASFRQKVDISRLAQRDFYVLHDQNTSLEYETDVGTQNNNLTLQRRNSLIAPVHYDRTSFFCQLFDSCAKCVMFFWAALILLAGIQIYFYGVLVPDYLYIQVHHDHLPPQ